MKKLFAAIVIIGVATFLWYQFELRPADSSDHVRSQVTIEKGMSSAAIADALQKQGLIRSSFAFKIYAKLHRTQSGLQAGSFFLQPSMSVSEIIDVLSKGVSQEMSITVPEGFTVKDIDVLLAEKGITKPGDITTCAQTCDFSAFTFLPSGAKLANRGGKIEGYVYPDTYFVTTASFDAKAFLDRLLETFDKRVVKGLSMDLEQSKRSLHEVMTMASLIEEETRGSAERPVVAGILWKRFDNGIGLGVDASVRYIVNKSTAAITKNDLEIDSPYNLRKYRGLPPGPIASPSLESIKAALHPVASEYLFYLHGKDGQIHYAKTNEEHNANRAKYLP